MAPPGMSTPGGEQAVAKDNLDKARKLISDLEKKGVQVSEAKGWFDQAQDMFRSGLYRTSIIYSGYALDAANELVQRIKDMVLRVTKVKARAIDMLGADNKNMPKIDELISEMKRAINEGRLDDCQELISGVDEMLRGGSSPYISTARVRTDNVVKTAQPSRGYSSCPSCGNITESTWTQCKYCGQDLREEEAQAQSGPSWQSGEGPHLVSDKGAQEDETDRSTDEDLQQMDTTEEELEKVGTDLDSSEDQMVGEAERTVDDRTSTDMQEQEVAEQEMERTEEDLERAQPLPLPLPPPLPPPIVPMERKPVDEETSTDMQEQESIESDLEKLQSDLDKPVEEAPRVEVAAPVEPPKELEKPPEEARRPEAVIPVEPPKEEVKTPEEPPKAGPPLGTTGPEAPPPAPTEVQKPPPPPPPPNEAPKRFFIPPPPRINFDDIKLPTLKASSKPRTCPKCGEEVEADFKSCPICKTPLG